MHLVCRSLRFGSEPRHNSTQQKPFLFRHNTHSILSSIGLCMPVPVHDHGIVHVRTNNFNVCIELPKRISETGLFFFYFFSSFSFLFLVFNYSNSLHLVCCCDYIEIKLKKRLCSPDLKWIF